MNIRSYSYSRITITFHMILHSLDCPDKKTPAASSSGSGNLQLIIIIVCVILLIVIVLLVVIFLLYRRRALCFGKIKQQNKTEKNIHVELQNIETAPESKYDNIDDNLGNPLYASVGGNNDDTEPMLSPVKKKPDKFIPQTGKLMCMRITFPKMNSRYYFIVVCV